MKRTGLLRLAPAVAFCLVVSCTTPMCGCPPSRTHAVVHGTVRTAAGAPVPGAAVNITIYRDQCGQGFSEHADQGRPQTDATGAYEAPFHSHFGPRQACLRVSATRGQGASADSAVTEGTIVHLRDEDDRPARVRVDIVFAGS